MSEHPKLITPISFGGDLRQAPTVATAAGPRTKMGDFLALTLTTSDSSGSVEINYRFLTDDGEILHGTQLMTFSGTGTQTAVVARLGDGWLQGFSVHRVSGTLTDGEVVAAVHLGRGEGSLARYECCLASGWITDVRSLGMGAFSDGSVTTITTTQPTITTATASPAAGANFAITVTASQVWEIQTLYFRLVTSAVAGNRQIYAVVTDGTNTLWKMDFTAYQTAGQTRQYNFGPLGAQYTGVGGLDFVLSLPPFLLGAGYTIGATISGIDAGDQISLVRLLYRQY